MLGDITHLDRHTHTLAGSGFFPIQPLGWSSQIEIWGAQNNSKW